jgi:2-desacetyl-2-hydroxyethyl bacteriochlorophyllide A dehydrogenase
MRSYQFNAAKTPLAAHDGPVPRPGAKEVLVEVKAAGICGSDVHVRNGVMATSKTPITLGHEIAGILVEKGVDATQVEEGDSVVVDYVISCGRCQYCALGKDNLCVNGRAIGFDLDGGFADRIVVPAENVVKLPDGLPFEQGAIIGCAVATSFHATKIAEVSLGDDVAIFGLGGVGMHAVLWAMLRGAKNIIGVDVARKKLEFAKEFGATHVIDPNNEGAARKISEITGGKGVEAAMDFAGQPATLNGAINSLARGGRIVVVGRGPREISISPWTFLRRELQMRTSSDHLRNEIPAIVEQVRKGNMDLSKSISTRLPLERVNDGLDALENNGAEHLRIALAP